LFKKWVPFIEYKKVYAKALGIKTLRELEEHLNKSEFDQTHDIRATKQIKAAQKKFLNEIVLKLESAEQELSYISLDMSKGIVSALSHNGELLKAFKKDLDNATCYSDYKSSIDFGNHDKTSEKDAKQLAKFLVNKIKASTWRKYSLYNIINSVVGFLFEREMYNEVIEIANELSLSDTSFKKKSTCLFKIAYSYNQLNYKDKALEIYQFQLSKNELCA